MAGLMDLLAGKIEGPMMEGLQQFTGLLQNLKTGIESGLNNDRIIYGKMEELKMLIEERLDKLENELAEMRVKYGTAFATPVEAAQEGALAVEIEKVEAAPEVHQGPEAASVPHAEEVTPWQAMASTPAL